MAHPPWMAWLRRHPKQAGWLVGVMSLKSSVPAQGRSPCPTLLAHLSSSLSLGKTVFVSIAHQDFDSDGHFVNYPYVWLFPAPPSSELALPFCDRRHSLDTISLRYMLQLYLLLYHQLSHLTSLGIGLSQFNMT